MNKDPVKILLEVMQKEGGRQNPPSIIIGEVISPQPDLKVKIAGVQIDRDNLLVADYLLDNYTRQVNVPLTGAEGEMSSVSVGGYGSHTHEISKVSLSGSLEFISALNQGDMLAVMPMVDMQTFIILCKVVRP